MTTASNAPKFRPLHTEKIGALSASIWSNAASESRTFYSVTFERAYRGDGNERKTSSSFNHDDLLNLAKLAERAEAYIAMKMAEDRPRAAAGPAWSVFTAVSHAQHAWDHRHQYSPQSLAAPPEALVA